jgi:hypothetical protein
MKTCKICQVEQPLDNFYKQNKYYNSYCKQCAKSISIKWKQKNPDYHPTYNLQYKYRLTKQQHNDMLCKQNFCCAICNLSFNETKPFVDHNHTTGKVRDLLCYHCNLGIGQMRENPDILKAAIEYLQKHNA